MRNSKDCESLEVLRLLRFQGFFMPYFLHVRYALVNFEKIFAGLFGYAMLKSVIFRGFDTPYVTTQNTFLIEGIFPLEV